jgi:hypothetical protein
MWRKNRQNWEAKIFWSIKIEEEMKEEKEINGNQKN